MTARELMEILQALSEEDKNNPVWVTASDGFYVFHDEPNEVNISGGKVWIF